MRSRPRSTDCYRGGTTEKLLATLAALTLLALAACANPMAPEDAAGPSHTTSSGNHTTSSGNLAPR